MIETIEAIENLEAIASTKNLHGLYIGPSDLSISLGLTKIADFRDDSLISVLKNVIAIAKKHHLTTATQVYDVEQAKIAKTLGFDIVTPIDDSALFENAMKEKMEIIKSDLI